MSLVTFQLVEGLERGRTYDGLPTPITIGREDDNQIQLNDERVSRFHAKVQEDDGRVILTDLDSTNGTRVNGHPVQMRILQPGDQVAIGRCLLVYGSREEIAERLAHLDLSDSGISDPSDHTIAAQALPASAGNGDSELAAVAPGELFPKGPPPPPDGLRAVQRAEISDFVAYAHEQIRHVVEVAFEDPHQDPEARTLMHVGWAAWQRLLQLEIDLARYLRSIAEPDSMH